MHYSNIYNNFQEATMSAIIQAVKKNLDKINILKFICSICKALIILGEIPAGAC